MAREALLRSGDGHLTGSRSPLRRVNSLGLLRAVLRQPQTLRELAQTSGLSRTAVDAVVSDLVAQGWLESASRASEGRLGRPATAYRVRPSLGPLLSIDIGAHHVCAVLSELAGASSGTTLGELRGEVGEHQSAAERVQAALAVADALLTSRGLGRDDVWVVTVGSPGVISAAGCVTYFGGSGMPGWIGLDLRTRLSREFGAAIVVEGDVALGAAAELAVGAAQGVRDVVYVLCGARTSGASIVNGAVHRGVHGAAGIVGELGALRWAELADEVYAEPGFGPSPPAREEIFALARNGNDRALQAVDAFADVLATGAAAMVLAFDPELVVVGGGSSLSADLFMPRFEATLHALCPVAPRVAVSTLGSEAVALGGVSLALVQVMQVLESSAHRGPSFPDPSATQGLLSSRSASVHQGAPSAAG